MGTKKPQGSVTVIGGGIAGIQSSLSLSEAGYTVNLVEQTATLGGIIPNLHRFYPICSCCKLNPRIAACEQDPRINVMVDTLVKGVSGQAGTFELTVETGGKEEKIACGAIVLAGGLETFEPSEHETYAYGRYPNVLTSVEYEQMQKPLGPGQGRIERPSDGRPPKNIAWLQCVGSRDINRCDVPYCSSVCCMYALKEAVNSTNTLEALECTIFYMDMRTHGKGYEEYLNDAVAHDVRLVRSRVHSVEPVKDSDDLILTYADESGNVISEQFEMVVLSVGIKPHSGAASLAETMGVDLNQNGFVNTSPFSPVSTNVPGIFTCGALAGPHDIHQSIIQATASAAEIASFLNPDTSRPEERLPETRETLDAEPKIFLAYHLCPEMTPDTGKHLEAIAKKAPGVVSISGLGPDLLKDLTEGLKNAGANRLVFAGCTPAIHKSLIEEALGLAGLNPFFYETCDLRLLDSENPSSQIEDRLRMSLARATLNRPTGLKKIPVSKHALVVGGGVAGLESALSISKEGYPVTLVEKDKTLGGHARHVRVTWQGNDAQVYLKDLIDSVEKDDNITVMTETRVKKNGGSRGNFTTTLESGGKEQDIAHGITVLAPGGETIAPGEYLYGKNHNVYLWSELGEKMLEDPGSFKKAASAVFIQCVGSREPSCPHCSNLCCSSAVRSAIDMKTAHPDMDIFILYREMRTFGEREDLYRDARTRGIVFIRYDVDNKPLVESAGKDAPMKVKVWDPVLGRDIILTPDFISLQTAIVSRGNRELAEIFKVDLDENGFFAESPEKMKPMDSMGAGVFIAGLAAYPKSIEESIAQAKAASARALETLKRDMIVTGGLTAEVMPEKCAVCCTCVRTCPFHVPVIDDVRGAAYIDPALCRGCGMCVAECPGKAIEMGSCTDTMLTRLPSIVSSA